MKPSELASSLEYLVKIKQPAIVWGDPGIGKSQVVHQTANHLGMQLKDVRAVLLDPVDLRGLPVYADGKAKWAIPAFLPTEGNGILFLDELNRAPALVQNACFQLVLDRQLGEYKLPDGWAVIAACNKSGSGVTKMSDALRNRFVHLQAETDIKDWCKWAITANIEPVTIAFLRFRPDLLHKFETTSDAFPSPRSWEFVSKITAASMGNTAIEYGLYAGAVGEGAAIEYKAFLDLYKELPNINSILLNPSTSPVPSKPATLFAISAALARMASVTNIARVLQYLDRLPEEYAVMAVKDAVQRDESFNSLPELTKWYVKHQESFS